MAQTVCMRQSRGIAGSRLMDQIVDYLSDYAAALSFHDLPAEVVHHAKRLLIDTLGCAIGGYASAPSKMARALAATVMSQQPATVLGSGQQTTATFISGRRTTSQVARMN